MKQTFTLLSLLAAVLASAFVSMNGVYAQDGGEKTSKNEKTAKTEKKEEAAKTDTRHEKHEKSVQDYIKDLESADPAVQIMACRKLATKKSEEAISALIQTLENVADAEVRWNAAMALGAIGKAGPTTTALLKTAREGKSKTLRYASLLGLANIQDKEKLKEFEQVAIWTKENSDDKLAQDLASKVLKKLGK